MRTEQTEMKIGTPRDIFKCSTNQNYTSSILTIYGYMVDLNLIFCPSATELVMLSGCCVRGFKQWYSYQDPCG